MTVTVPPRDRDLEIDYLGTIETAVAAILPAGGGLRAQVLERLEAGQGVYGDQWRERPIADLAGELAEEAADIGGWGVLTLQRIRGAQLTSDQHEAASALLALITFAGGQAHAASVILRRLLDEAGV